MPDLQVAIPSMREAVKGFEKAKGDCLTHQRAVETTVTGLVGGSWDGTAAKSFGGVMEDWKIQFNRVLEALQSLTDNFNVNIANYEAKEAENATRAGSNSPG
jgi:WXG100 family type VII secretion target